MRYYDLIVKTASGKVINQWTSHPKGEFDPGALNIEFDIITAPYGTPIGTQVIMIHGISLADVSQAKQYTGMKVELRAGMKKGLPLASPKQAGIIAAGQIFQSFGNWEGTEMVLNFVITPSPYSMTNPGNIVLNWPKGSDLKDALSAIFSLAYPGYPVVMNLSQAITEIDILHYCSSLEQLGTFVENTTTAMGNPVYITIQSGQIIVSDALFVPPVVKLDIYDMVGQPVWIGVNEIQIKLIMRADISIRSHVEMPKELEYAPGVVLTSAAAYSSQEKYKSAFNGKFRVKEQRSLGNYKAPSGASWITMINCLNEQ